MQHVPSGAYVSRCQRVTVGSKRQHTAAMRPLGPCVSAVAMCLRQNPVRPSSHRSSSKGFIANSRIDAHSNLSGVNENGNL